MIVEIKASTVDAACTVCGKKILKGDDCCYVALTDYDSELMCMDCRDDMNNKMAKSYSDFINRRSAILPESTVIK